jgi:putative FmdB family regulatory protein
MMPTYAYRCEACDFEFERFQAITANALRKCPECGKLKLRRLLGTGAGILFKGGGFYQTDYRSDSYKEAAKQDKPATDKKESPKKKDGADKAKTDQTDKKKTA